MQLLPRPDFRSLVPSVLAGALVVLIARPAAAQVDLGGSKITMELQLPVGDDDFEDVTNEVTILEYMNLANCSCGDATPFQIEFSLDPPTSNVPSQDEQVDIWVGTSCAAETLEEQNELCFNEGNIAEVSDLLQVPARPISVRHLVGPTGSSPECTRRDEHDRAVYAIIDPGQNGFDDKDGDYQTALTIKADTDPPPEPDGVIARGSEGGITIDFAPPTSREDDILYYQVLCARVDDPGNKTGFGDFEQHYLTSQQACGSDADAVCPRAPGGSTARRAGGGDAGVPDAGDGSDAGTGGDAGSGPGEEPTGECVTGLPGGLDTLDPSHLCGQADGTAGSVDAKGLENGVAYHVVLLVVDEARNVTAIDAGEATPRPVQDFWEDYKQRGGQASGGCSAAQAGFGGGLALIVALGAGVLLRVGGRRRKGRGGNGRRGGPGAAAGGALILVLALAPQLADAQPWWEEYENPVQEQVGPAQPHWGLELKIAPYVPDVDSEFGGGEVGPFELMFGDGPYLMSGFTLDRYLLHPMGQLGVSLSAGFLSRSANAYQIDDEGEVILDPDSGRPVRAVGDTTWFRMVPMSLGVVYRFTQLDDLFRIPLVPYGRAGLSYYYWWISKPGGGLSEVPTDSCPDVENGDCEGDRARGGSLGWQATAGLAIRAERIDPGAEQSLRNELGIEHAGLVFEFTYAKVDGFGADDKLAVGDATFFGGINFEF